MIEQELRVATFVPELFPHEWRGLTLAERQELCRLVISNRPVEYHRISQPSLACLHGLEQSKFIVLRETLSAKSIGRKVMPVQEAQVTARGKQLVEKVQRLSQLAGVQELLEQLHRSNRRRPYGRRQVKQSCEEQTDTLR